MSLNNMRKNSFAVIAAATLSLAGAAHAQNVIVQVPDNAAELRAAMEASTRAAAQGRRVGMVTGRADPTASREANGATYHELDATTLMYSVARINADGSITRLCVNGLVEAEQAALVPDFAKRMTPMNRVAKEKLDVK